jgi:hypothetical protein
VTIRLRSFSWIDDLQADVTICDKSIHVGIWHPVVALVEYRCARGRPIWALPSELSSHGIDEIALAPWVNQHITANSAFLYQDYSPAVDASAASVAVASRRRLQMSG